MAGAAGPGGELLAQVGGQRLSRRGHGADIHRRGLAQVAVTLVQLAAGVIIAAELTGAGLTALSQAAPPGHSLPGWLIAVAWIPFTLGLAWTFNARMRDVPWMLLLVYLAWGVQELVLAHSLVNPQEGETGPPA